MSGALVQVALVMAVAAAMTAVLTPLSLRAATRIGLVSIPRADRHGRKAIPLLGGAAMAVACVGVLVLVAPSGTGLVVAACAFLAFGLGLLDDIRRLAPSTKLVGQVVVASLLAFGGVQVEVIPFAPVAFLLTVFWVVGIMNAINLMDNMDGLAAGITVIAGVSLAIAALTDPGPAAFIAAAAAGAGLGYLPHNFPPARTFMGDAGSQMLGLLLAAAALLSTATSATNVGLALIGPLAVLALPIFDTALVAVSRRLAGISVGQGGRDHASHRLAALGLSDRGVVLVLYALSAILAVVGVLATEVGSLVVPVAVIALVGLVLFGVFLHEVDVYGWRERGEASVNDSRGNAVRRALWLYGRFGAEIGLDAVLLTVAYYSSFLIRFEGPPEASWLHLFVQSVPIVVVAQLATLVLLGVYRTLWRYIGVSDATLILRAVVLGTALAALALVLGYRFESYSRAVFLIDVLLATSLLIGSRAFLLWLQQWSSSRPRADSVRVLIVGANERGLSAHRLLTRSMDRPYRVVGFVDDDPGKRHRSIAGVRIVGAIADLSACVERYAVQLVILAQPQQDVAIAVRSACLLAGVECRELLIPV